MAYIKRFNADDIISQIRACVAEINDFRNDGWVTQGCKHELYRVKCYLEDVYQQLPEYPAEAEWEKERIVEILKK